jgi:hypothetical protein
VEAGVVGKPSFSTFQAIVAVVAGMSSIAGAAYSALGTFRAPPAPGAIVAVVRDGATAQPVPNAVVEVLDNDGTLVTTAVQGDYGFVRRPVPPGPYQVRVVHPDFVEVVRDVQVASSNTSELRVLLERRPRSAAPARGESSARGRGSVADGAAHVVDKSVGAGRRLLSRLGF